jgi:hypothetical protein
MLARGLGSQTKFYLSSLDIYITPYWLVFGPQIVFEAWFHSVHITVCASALGSKLNLASSPSIKLQY